MAHVITVPSSLDDLTFEQVLDQVAAVPADAVLTVDARHTEWASPFGLTALLALAQTRRPRPVFLPPEKEDTASHWARSHFFRHAAGLYEINGRVPVQREERESGTLLEITPVSRNDDVHTVIVRIQGNAAHILTQNLHLDSRAVMGFAMTLSEICQTMIEDSGGTAWVAVQNFSYRKRMGRHVVQMAVCSSGRTVRESLELKGERPANDRWDDGVALETAIIQGTSRFEAHGRGQGFKGIRGYLRKWQGKLSVRSGTARVADVPAWDDDVVHKDNLAPFPGIQVQIMIPEAVVG